jgi:sarcosine oxidase subunit beta
VLVLEAGTVASGASGGPGQRGVRASGRDARELPLARRATELWPGLAGAIGGPTGYEQVGHLELIERTADLEAAKATMISQRDQGVPTELVSATELQSLEPGLSDRIIGALLCPLDGVADHTATTTSLGRAATRLGVRIREHTTVAGMRVDGRRVAAAVTTDGEEITVGRTLFLLCNTGVAELVASVGCQLPVFPVWPQVVVTAPMAQVPVRHLLGHASRPLALKALPGGEVMITGGRLGRWDHAAGRAVVDPSEVEANLADARAVVPGLDAAVPAVVTADRADTATVDLVPIIDRLPGTTNALFATGWTGHGWAIAPAVAELLVAWALDDRPPDVLAPLGRARFGAS